MFGYMEEQNVKEILIKILKGLALGVVFGGVTYLITKDMGTAGLIVLVMVLSMFAQSKEQKIEKVEKYTKKSKKSRK